MAERDRRLDELLEAHLRALPDVDPPVELADRVMAEVLADEADFERTPQQTQPVRRISRIPAWQTATVGVLFSVIVTVLLVRSADTWIRLLADVSRMSATVVHFAVDMSVSVAAFGWALLKKTVIASGAFVTVLRTIMDVAVAEAGAFIIVAAVLGVGLQVVLLTVVRRRPEVP